MKLISTEIDETTVEVTLADGPLTDDAETLVIVRMPLDGPDTKSLAWHQLRVLSQGRDVIAAEMQRLKQSIEAVS